MDNMIRPALIVMLSLSACATVWDAGCPVPPPIVSHPAAAPRRTRNVIVVTLDGVRWQEIFEGVDADRARRAGLPACQIVAADALLPNLRGRLAERGVAVGAPGHGKMFASGPNFVSLPGYREIFTGRAGHSCTSNFCDPIAERTLLDELSPRLGPAEIGVITSWRSIELAAARDPSAITISAGRHGGATRQRLASPALEAGRRAGAYPGWLDYRPDRFTAQLALDYLVAERPRFLFVGLGDTDEYAHRGNYAGYLAALRAADRFVGALLDSLAAMGDYGAEATVIVTTDHGRAASFSGHGGGAPESSQVWLLAAGGAVPATGFAGGAPARLADIAPTVRSWMGLPVDRSASAGVPVAALLTGGASTLVASGWTAPGGWGTMEAWKR